MPGQVAWPINTARAVRDWAGLAAHTGGRRDGDR